MVGGVLDGMLDGVVDEEAVFDAKGMTGAPAAVLPKGGTMLPRPTAPPISMRTRVG